MLRTVGRWTLLLGGAVWSAAGVSLAGETLATSAAAPRTPAQPYTSPRPIAYAAVGPLGDPRRQPPLPGGEKIESYPQFESYRAIGFVEPAFRTALYDPTSENRDLFSMEPLPPVAPDSFHDGMTDPEQTSPPLPAGAKPGVVQQLMMSGTFLAGGNSPNSLGINEIAFRGTLGFPFFTIESPLLISPGFTMHLLDGPRSVDVPPRLYEAYVDFRWLRRLTPKLGMDLAVTPGVFSDFNKVGSQSIRIQGRGLGAYDWSERLRLVAGVLYLDRDDIRLLPAAGAFWTPNDDVRFELIFPRPRIARRLFWSDEVAWWAYLLGELGGNSYGVTMADGSQDTLTYRDYRFMLGIERKVNLRIGGYFEVGYVFGRELEYLSGPPPISPPGTVLVRGGLVY